MELKGEDKCEKFFQEVGLFGPSNADIIIVG